MAELKVGAARILIDPPAEAYPFPTNFCVAEESRNPCHVRAVCIDSGEKRVLFVVYELSDIPGIPDLTARLAEAAHIPEEDVILTVTHNHSSPCDRCKVADLPDKFAMFRQIELSAGISAARKAVETLRPARWGYGEIDCPINVNRDLKTRFGFWVEGPNYAGYSNSKLTALKFTDMEGKLIAALLNFGAHAVCAFAQPDADGKIKTSSNFPGIACAFCEEHYGGDSVVAWTSGAAGNQDPILFDYQWIEYPDGYVTKIALPDGSGYVHMDALGTRQGADAVALIDSIEETDGVTSLKHLHSVVSVPAQKRDPSFVIPPFGLRMGGVGPRTDFSAPKMPALPKMLPDEEHTVDYTLNLLMIDDLAVLLTSGELYAEIARDMMAAIPAKRSFVVTHIPGGGGYTLDRGSADHLTFQAFGRVRPGSADDPLIQQSIRLVQFALR